VHLAHGVEFVVLAGEQGAELEQAELGSQAANSRLQLTGDRVVGLLLRQLVEDLSVRQPGPSPSRRSTSSFSAAYSRPTA